MNPFWRLIDRFLVGLTTGVTSPAAAQPIKVYAVQSEAFH